MARLALALSVVALLGCRAPRSQLSREYPLAELDESSVLQLCRFTVDLLSDADWSCTGATPPETQTDFDPCVADPPWVGFDDVASWEACVNARRIDPCGAADACTPAGDGSP